MPADRRSDRVGEDRNLVEAVPNAAAAHAALEAILRLYETTQQMMNSPGFARRPSREISAIHSLEGSAHSALKLLAVQHRQLTERMDEIMAKVHDPADRQQLSELLDSNTSRNTRKQGRGRPCIGKRAMTPAERQRRTVGNSRQSF